MRKIHAQKTGARPVLGGGDRESRSLPAELTADGEQKEREKGGSQQSFDDSQDAAPRIDRRVLRISLKCGCIDGRDSALADQFCLCPAIVRPGVLLVPDASVGRDCGIPRLRLLHFKAGEGKQERRSQHDS